MIRVKGKNLLEDIFENSNNVTLFEKLIYSKYNATYYDTIYQLCGLVQQYSVKECYELLNEERINWSLDMFKEDVEEERIELEFIETPFETSDSIMECRCGSKKVLTFSKQIRSSDEGTAVFCKCIKCGKKWVESG